uniref:Uncharacterized protein n=1 Tax=Plectus sambesii TaxID=2011161 RepID=A0A914XDP5_9BILA
MQLRVGIIFIAFLGATLAAQRELTDKEINELATGVATTIMTISTVLSLIYWIVWIVVALVGYYKWDWTVLASVLVLLFGPCGLCCALTMNTRTQEREKAGYNPGQARPI